MPVRTFDQQKVLEKKLLPKEKGTLLFAGLGAGVTWGAMIYRFM